MKKMKPKTTVYTKKQEWLDGIVEKVADEFDFRARNEIVPWSLYNSLENSNDILDEEYGLKESFVASKVFSNYGGVK